MDCWVSPNFVLGIMCKLVVVVLVYGLQVVMGFALFLVWGWNVFPRVLLLNAWRLVYCLCFVLLLCGECVFVIVVLLMVRFSFLMSWFYGFAFYKLCV